MIVRRTLGPIAAVAMGAVVLSGCALLSSPPEVQMYRFGSAVQPGQTLPVDAPAVNLRRIEFPDGAETDRVLGVTGNEAAYIAGARWVSPAQDLYAASVESAFASQARRVRLIGPREGVRGDQVLALDVQTFEARYDAPGAVPTVVVTVRARLMRARDITAERTFSVSQPAGENRVATIVQAFETATRDVNTQIVDWTDTNATVDPAGE